MVRLSHVLLQILHDAEVFVWSLQRKECSDCKGCAGFAGIGLREGLTGWVTTRQRGSHEATPFSRGSRSWDRQRFKPPDWPTR